MPGSFLKSDVRTAVLRNSAFLKEPHIVYDCDAGKIEKETSLAHFRAFPVSYELRDDGEKKGSWGSP